MKVDKPYLDRPLFLAVLVCADGCGEVSDELCHGGFGHNEHGGHLRHLEHYGDEVVCVSQACVLADTLRGSRGITHSTCNVMVRMVPLQGPKAVVFDGLRHRKEAGQGQVW